MAPLITFEKFCKLHKVSSKILIDVSALPADEQKYFIALFKLNIIARALNGNWIPNWKSGVEKKWFPWFNMDASTPSGFGFSFSAFVNWYARTYCGSRLCFKTQAISDYVAKNFIDLYRDVMVYEGIKKAPIKKAAAKKIAPKKKKK